MKDIYKNPILYYILIPVLIAMWPLLLKGVYLPRMVELQERERSEFEAAQKPAKKILEIDPARVKFGNSENIDIEFDYATVLNKIASRYGIRPNKYSVSEKPARIAARKKTQNATVNLSEIDLKTFAQFLSALLQDWTDLECENIKLTRNEGLKDSWDIDVRFKYTSSVR